LQVRCCIQEERVNVKQTQELNLPLQSKQNKDVSATIGYLSPEDVKETLKAAREKFGRTTVTKALQEAKRQLGKQGVAKLTLFGGAAAVGVFLSGSLLTSLEVLPMVPEAMQTVGLAYSVLVASRVIRGDPEKFKVSPIRAVLEIVEEGEKKKVQRTSLVMPQVRLADTSMQLYFVFFSLHLCPSDCACFSRWVALRHMSTVQACPQHLDSEVPFCMQACIQAYSEYKWIYVFVHEC